MFKSINTQSIPAITTAALVAASVVASLAIFVNSVVPEARAESQGKGALHQPHVKRDRLTVRVKATACSLRGRPRYEQTGQFDMRRPANGVRNVRIIALR